MEETQVDELVLSLSIAAARTHQNSRDATCLLLSPLGEFNHWVMGMMSPFYASRTIAVFRSSNELTSVISIT